MTLEEARTDLILQANQDLSLYKGLTLDGDGNPVEEAVGATDLLSRACIWWSELTYCNYDDSVDLTLTVNQTTPYDCRDLNVVSKRILQPRTVIINDHPLTRRDGRQYGLWTFPELQRDCSQWRLAEATTPRVAIWLPGGKLRLWPKTDDAYTGKNFIEAWTIPDDLEQGSDDSVELPVPSEDHLSIVRLALVLGTLPGLSGQEAWQRAGANDASWREQAERKKRANINAFLGRRPRGSQADWLWGGRSVF